MPAGCTAGSLSRGSRSPHLRSAAQARHGSPSAVREPQCPRPANLRDPTPLEEALEHGGSERAGEMRPALRPVQAAARERPARSSELGDVDAQHLGEPALPAGGHLVQIAVLRAKKT